MTLDNDTLAILTELTADREGFRRKPYLCTAGYLTIGYGHRIKSGSPLGEDETISEYAAHQLLRHDLMKAWSDAEFLIMEKGVEPKEIYYIAVTLMIFQMGLAGTRRFRRFFRAMLTNNRPAMVVELMNSKWYGQTPIRVADVTYCLISGRIPGT